VLCVCPSFFMTNLGESMRTPDAGTEDTLTALMENSSDKTAADVAADVIRSWESAGVYVLPHEKATLAWEQKRQAPEAYLEATRPLADSIARKARRKTGQ
jgi:hypothetical protein